METAYFSGSLKRRHEQKPSPRQKSLYKLNGMNTPNPNLHDKINIYK